MSNPIYAAHVKRLRIAYKKVERLFAKGDTIKAIAEHKKLTDMENAYWQKTSENTLLTN